MCLCGLWGGGIGQVRIKISIGHGNSNIVLCMQHEATIWRVEKRSNICSFEEGGEGMGEVIRGNGS